jgi:ABC-type multidrug transport system fused ATPase/permease subunit
MLNNAYKSLLDIVTSFTRASGAAQRVFSLLDSLPDIDIDKGKAVPYGSLLGDITIQNVSFSYQMRPNFKVLYDVTLNIPRGTTCALVGKSGGGKTTLVSLLMRFYDPKEGQILLDGVPLTELCLRDVRRSIGKFVVAVAMCKQFIYHII